MAGKKKAARKVDTSEFCTEENGISQLPTGEMAITKVARNADGSIYVNYEIGGEPIQGKGWPRCHGPTRGGRP